MQILGLGHRFEAKTMREHAISMAQYLIHKKAMMAGKTMLYCYGIRTQKSTYKPPSLLFHGVQQLGKLFEGLSWRRKIELLIHLHLLVKVQTYNNNLIHVGQ